MDMNGDVMKFYDWNGNAQRDQDSNGNAQRDPNGNEIAREGELQRSGNTRRSAADECPFDWCDCQCINQRRKTEARRMHGRRAKRVRDLSVPGR